MGQRISRRAVLLAAAAASIRRLSAAPSNWFTDDARRRVVLPQRVGRVFAAGAPAEILLYTLAPAQLVGRNHMPAPEALEFMPEAWRHPHQIEQLPDARSDAHDGELRALQPDLYLDYGDLHPDFIASVDAIQQRTGIPAIILDGRLEKLPSVYRRLGKALGAARRGELLARETERILRSYGGRLRATAPKVFLSCSTDTTVPCAAETLSGEVADILGAHNVAGNLLTELHRQVTAADMLAWGPDCIVATSQASAMALLARPALQALPAVAARNIRVPPSQPFSWGMRPPSVNRLLGLMWLAYAAVQKPFDAAFSADLRRFYQLFYQVPLSDGQIERLLKDS